MDAISNKILDKNEVDVVLYHGSCYDGFGSAFVVWNYYKQMFNLDRATQIKYIPCYYQKENQPFPNDFLQEITGKNVLMCDFSYKYNQLLQLIGASKSFMILDHHKTAEADLKQIPENLKIFDMKRSGSGITWDFFYPGLQIPKFLAHIQDRDLWSFIVQGTQPFVIYFYEQEHDFELWETYLDEQKVSQAIEIGNQWIDYQKLIIDQIVKKTTYIIQEVNGQYAIVLYCNSSILKSDVGNKMFDKFPLGDFSCVWDYDLRNNQTLYSLRSTDERMDVSAISTKIGGGGHRNASGVGFPGLVDSLPFVRKEDFGIISLLSRATKGTVNMLGTEQKYTLFNVNEIREEWLSQDYFDLIKRKCNDSAIIVFEKQSELVNFDEKTGEIIPLRDYNIFLNEKEYKNPLNQLQSLVFGLGEYALSFSSANDFSKVFDNVDEVIENASKECEQPSENISNYIVENVDDMSSDDDMVNKNIVDNVEYMSSDDDTVNKHIIIDVNDMPMDDSIDE